MILPDVNVLVYAFREEVPHHELCRAWLRQIILGDARFGISRMVLSAVVRVTTDQRIIERQARWKMYWASAKKFSASHIVKLSSPASDIGEYSRALLSKQTRLAAA